MHAGTALHREQSGETGDALYFPKGKTFRKTDVFAIDKAHIKLWAPSRQAAIFGAVLGVKRTQSLLCKATGCGFFGLQLETDAVVRFDALEDNQISVDHVPRLVVEASGQLRPSRSVATVPRRTDKKTQHIS